MAKKTVVLEYLSEVNSDLLIEFRKNKNKKYPIRIVPADDLRLEIGFGLIPLVEKKLNNNLLDRIKDIRKRITNEIGVNFPTIHILDNIELGEYEYRFFIHGKIYCKYKIPRNKYLCLDKGRVKNKITGEKVEDPVFGLPAIYINKKDIDQAVKSGYVIADSPSIIRTHLEQIIKTNISKIFSYDCSNNILIDVAKKYPNLVKDIRRSYKKIEIKQILEKLLSKNMPIKNIRKIFELMLINLNHKNDLNKLIENIILGIKKG